jgi:hypothetical protein
MAQTRVEQLERQREALYAQLAATGDFRRGSVNETFRRCGKPNCACAGPDHRGHGPRHVWTKSVHGKTQTRQVAAGELDKVRAEVAAYGGFTALVARIVEVNEAICEARPVAQGSAPAMEPEKRGSSTGS